MVGFFLKLLLLLLQEDPETLSMTMEVVGLHGTFQKEKIEMARKKVEG